MRVRQLVRLGALCAAALMLCSCDFLGFDGDIEPDGLKGSIVHVDRNNRFFVLFDGVDEWELPLEFEGVPAQWIQLAGVEGFEPLNAEDKGHPYGKKAKEAVKKYLELHGETVYIEWPDGEPFSAGDIEGKKVYWAIAYLDYDVSLNEEILRNGLGRPDEPSTPDYLRWEFEQAADEARENKVGYYNKNTWQSFN